MALIQGWDGGVSLLSGTRRETVVPCSGADRMSTVPPRPWIRLKVASASGLTTQEASGPSSNPSSGDAGQDQPPNAGASDSAAPAAPAPEDRQLPIQPVSSTPAQSSGRSVSFESKDRSAGWELARSDGALVCALPCTTNIHDTQGYALRTKGGSSQTTFLGSEVGTRVVLEPPAGAKTTAAITAIVSAIVGGVGVALYFAGNTQECEYGPMKDTNGNITYAQKVSGTCAKTDPPPGFQQTEGVDSGATSSSNRKTGVVLAGLGAAGLLTGGIWWLASGSEPKLTWSNGAKATPGAGFGVALNAAGVSLRGAW